MSETETQTSPDAGPDVAPWVAPEFGVVRQPMTVNRLEALQKEAFEEAYQQGFQAGRQAGLETMTERVECLDQCIRALEKPFAELDDDVGNALVELALAASQQIVRREIQQDPGHIAGVLTQALDLLPVSSRDVQVYMHPQDVAVIREAYSLTGREPWELFEDPAISRGGLRLTSENTSIDARVEKRLADMLALIAGEARESDD